jgi:hypothetical protein
LEGKKLKLVFSSFVPNLARQKSVLFKRTKKRPAGGSRGGELKEKKLKLVFYRTKLACQKFSSVPSLTRQKSVFQKIIKKLKLRKF